MTGWRLTSSMPAMMRCFSSCFDVTPDMAQDGAGELREEAFDQG